MGINDPVEAIKWIFSVIAEDIMDDSYFSGKNNEHSAEEFADLVVKQIEAADKASGIDLSTEEIYQAADEMVHNWYTILANYKDEHHPYADATYEGNGWSVDADDYKDVWVEHFTSFFFGYGQDFDADEDTFNTYDFDCVDDIVPQQYFDT